MVKIISNKITYLTSVYLIKVKGGGGGFVKLFMSCKHVTTCYFLHTHYICMIYAEKPKVIYEKTWNDFKTYVRDKNCVNTKLNL